MRFPLKSTFYLNYKPLHVLEQPVLEPETQIKEVLLIHNPNTIIRCPAKAIYLYSSHKLPKHLNITYFPTSYILHLQHLCQLTLKSSQPYLHLEHVILINSITFYKELLYKGWCLQLASPNKKGLVPKLAILNLGKL